MDGWQCPTPPAAPEQVLLGHGSGGRLSAALLRNLFIPAFRDLGLNAEEDQASLSLPCAEPNSLRLALTTDSYVVRPIFFPGGDIGRLAVNGTINDLAVGGARPIALAAAFILEEGLALSDLQRVVASMRDACKQAGINLVTGDTKVVDRGKGDQLYITTTGFGIAPPGVSLSVRNPRPGDRVLVSGTIGDHGIAIMSVREGIEFETVLESDTAPLYDLVVAMLEACPTLRWMRDPTRGGLSSALNELATTAHVGVQLTEAALPIRTEVQAACEMLGLDPLYVANEGKLVAVAPADDAGRLLAAMRGHPLGRKAALVGEVVADHAGVVTLRSLIGGERVVPMLAGEQLPRIC
ncbi:MAG: hydrogenase expression/formation protein HypE [Gemmataceae bacterium]|nr:hydrogenase expression/formation protein HypE [Gemmataceae bacterium]